MRVGMILAFVVLAANLLVAQTFRGTILGTVTDPTGAAVADSTVSRSNHGCSMNSSSSSPYGTDK